MQSGRSHGFGRSLPGLVALLVAGGAARGQAPPVIKVETNLVVVRVVVRDAKGRPVSGLRKDAFHLSDNGKAREITGFSEESSPATAVQPSAPASQPAAVPATAPAIAPAVPVMPQRFVALFFDDLHMEFGDVAHTRDAAWKYISTTLRADDRIGIFTASNQSHLDFTADRDKLHEVLFKLGPHGRANPTENQCPLIGEYQAYLMAVREAADAFEIAEAEGDKCDCGGEPKGTLYSLNMPRGDCEKAVLARIRGLAAQIWDMADQQSGYALDVIDGVINLLGSRAGQRTLVLISTGFLAETRVVAINRLVDRAVRRNIVINALDAAGLYTKDYTNPILFQRSDLNVRKFRINGEGRTEQRDVMVYVTQGTGGKFFQNSNDFDGGFRETVQAPDTYYVLSFPMQDVKLDGRFHTLKVSVDSPTFVDVQARRGYFASPPVEDKTPSKSDIEAAIYSLEEMQGMPATVSADAVKGKVTVKVHVEIRDLQFRKEGDRNIDTLTFDTAVFDRDGRYVMGKESSLDFKLPDAKLESLRQTGINAQTNLQVAPGVYRVREVVRDTETKKIAAVNYNLNVSPPSVETAVVTPPPKHGKQKKSHSMADWSTADFVKAMPELAGIEPAQNQDALGELLENVGAGVEDFFDSLPETAAHESIELERLDWAEHRREEFNYLAFPRNGRDSVGMEEYRTLVSGKRVEPQALEHGFVTKGFVSMVVHFHPAYQAESEFRYLGRQNVEGHLLEVVSFVQIPNRARIKQSLKTDIRSLVILIQGVAWIDPNNDHIVRMRTELLEPHDDPDLRQETTESRFAAVRFRNSPQAFWLPEEVTVTVNWQGMVFRNRHHYSQFQLFRVDTPAR